MLALVVSLLMISAFSVKSKSIFQSKDKSDKVLLKQLLEGFGLEIPSELEDKTTNVAKSIKGS